jgi:hypothetical protein
MSLPWHLIGQALSAAPRVGPSRSLGHSEFVAGATKCVIIVCKADYGCMCRHVLELRK